MRWIGCHVLDPGRIVRLDRRKERKMNIVGAAIAIWNAVVDLVDIASWFIP
ncbi:hypothetical protein ABH933_001297 [Nocardia sp. GP40]|uniref:hypothetical protein n=1 Tax=Nocardia sp. GP40 TaxID=3156268 RepID=UPI003D257B9D